MKQNFKPAKKHSQPIPLLIGRIGTISLSLMLSTVGLAIAAPNTQNTSAIQLMVDTKSQPAIQFEARQAPLAEILKQFASKTGAVIHYSVLPEEPVTATCAGDSVKQVMECLLGSRVDRVYRKVNNNSTFKALANNIVQKEEIWILGSRYGATGTSISCTLDGSSAKADSSAEQEQNPQTALMRMAQIIGDPRYAELGKQALSLLAAGGKTGNAETDAQITETLHNAFKDKNPEARAQAVFGLSQQDGDNTDVLHEALQDDNPDVRLMAVDSAKSDTPQGQAILNEALNDKDETVRVMAQNKLKEAANEQ